MYKCTTYQDSRLHSIYYYNELNYNFMNTYIEKYTF